MSGDPAELVGFLHRRAGDSLRSVMTYDADGFDVLYLREDIAERYTAAEAARVVSEMRDRESPEAVRERAGLSTDLQATVHCWDDHVGFHFRDGESGTLVAIDNEGAARLSDFVSACREHLD